MCVMTFSSDCQSYIFFFFFFNDTATTEIYTLSLHGRSSDLAARKHKITPPELPALLEKIQADRKSTRLNSSHANISYAVFCLKKKKKQNKTADLWTKTTILMPPPQATQPA